MKYTLEKLIEDVPNLRIDHPGEYLESLKRMDEYCIDMEDDNNPNIKNYLAVRTYEVQKKVEKYGLLINGALPRDEVTKMYNDVGIRTNGNGNRDRGTVCLNIATEIKDTATMDVWVCAYDGRFGDGLQIARETALKGLKHIKKIIEENHRSVEKYFVLEQEPVAT